MIELIKSIREGINRIEEGIRRNQEGIERNQKTIERNEELIRRNQEGIERIQEGNERIEEGIRRNQEEIERIQEVIERINENDIEMNDILNQLSVTIIEDIKRLNDENKKCVICLEDFKNFDKSIYLPCIHLFHEKCITDWVNTKKGFCPVCRSRISNAI